ncbi:apolipoprotein N-acyltransferase [Nibricoccus aquaticus]|uniref:Apolipoprotein N-acyltransferase n=1 Tax=Nibricoccus aquaticus TaxID=2576891 RepID=A0A290Q711_9BACT|nr:apolipoprotein N-acyltransferase [Nibricoccus aquaticus]ATC64284.1 apolipoprotein N-acyltransferase [Nibricoccus aquaticus]
MSQPTASTVFDPYAEQPPSVWKKHERWFWAGGIFFFTILLTVVSFPPFNAGEFAYAFAVPAVLWAYRRPSFKLFTWTLLAAQVVAWTLVLSWLHHVTWLGLFLLGPFVGAWVGLWYLGVWWVVPRMVGRQTGLRILAMLGLGGLWVLIEWTRTWFLGGFPWLPLAASQWKQISVLQIASYTGALGVSFVLITANLGFAAYANRLFFENLKGFNRRSQEFFTAMFLLIVCLTVHIRETVNRGHYTTTVGRVALVQPYIPQTVKWDESKAAGILDVLESTTERAARTRPDLILWPEAVTPYAVKGNASVQTWTESLVAKTGIPLLMGSVAIESAGQADARWVNGAFVIDPVVGLQSSSYAKRHLVPFGEFVPFRAVFGWLEKVTDVGEGDFHPGTSTTPLLISAKSGIFAVSPLICYEDIFPQLARESVLSGGEIFAVLTNNGWFGEGGAAHQHAAHSVLRAVETRRPVIRCGNGGWSGWIDEFGRVRNEMTNKEGSIYFRGTATYEISRDSRWIERPSFYTRFGDWFVGVSLLLVLLGFGSVAFALPAPAKSAAEDDSAPTEA